MTNRNNPPLDYENKYKQMAPNLTLKLSELNWPQCMQLIIGQILKFANIEIYMATFRNLYIINMIIKFFQWCTHIHKYAVICVKYAFVPSAHVEEISVKNFRKIKALF